MGFLKERKRAKELEETYNLIVDFKNRTKDLDLSKTNPQNVYDESESLLQRIASAKQIVQEDLNKAMAIVMGGWFATRDALLYECDIHKKRYAILERDESYINALKNRMLESGAKKQQPVQEENVPERGQ